MIFVAWGGVGARGGGGFVFKASYDKANRSSRDSPRGPGLEAGLALVRRVGDALGVPVTSDVHEPGQAAAAGAALDLLQVPAFLCRQTDLLVACGATGKAVNVKKGQWVAPAEMRQVVGKVEGAGAEIPGGIPDASPAAQRRLGGGAGAAIPDASPPTTDQRRLGGGLPGVMLTERGTFFGYHRLVNDFAGLGDLMELGRPVCFDVTHSTQQPGAEGATSGGRPERAPMLARAAVAAGVDAVFIETHPEPAKAMSDAAVMLPVEQTLGLLGELAAVRGALGG